MTSLATHPVLRHEPGNIIAGRHRPTPGNDIVSHNPADPDTIVWHAGEDAAAIDDAVGAARTAQEQWGATPVERRIEALLAYKELAAARAGEIAELICDETGKALWDCQGEAKLLGAKVDITLDDSQHSGRQRIAGFEVPIGDTRTGICAFRPHGVMCVLGPFNFPAHLPNGHIVPALLAGNAVVFKPSDKTPATGQALAELFNEALESAGAPAGLVNLVQGGASIASSLATHPGVDGILFTGSWPVGRKILEANLDTPGRIVALELGGNNPAIVCDDADLRQAAIECARAAFVTTGQRCSCTRRIIVHESVADRFVGAMKRIADALIVGDPRGIGGGSRNQPVFMGPLIRDEARTAVLRFQDAAIKAGADPILQARAIDHPSDGHFISPGILGVDSFTTASRASEDAGCDVEVFGPLVRVARYEHFDDALAQANATRYGLAASIFTTDPAKRDAFLARARAGCVNVNTGTAGASGKLPFGGLGLSGNHRPAGAFSTDYCAYPVASLVEQADTAALLPGMTFDESWV